jgi:hypothetical protein
MHFESSESLIPPDDGTVRYSPTFLNSVNSAIIIGSTMTKLILVSIAAALVVANLFTVHAVDPLAVGLFCSVINVVLH